MAKVVLGLFESRDSAKQAMRALEAEGFDRQRVEMRSGDELLQQAGTQPAHEPAEEGVWAGIKRFFSGARSEGRLSESGPQGLRPTDALVTVHVEDGRAERAVEIIDANGAQDIEERLESAGVDPGAATESAAGSGRIGGAGVLPDSAAGAAPTATTAKALPEGAPTADPAPATAGERRIPVVEEELRVGKREAASSGVHVRSRIIEHPVEKDVALREENVRVARTRIDRPLTEGDAAFREESFEVRATSEEPVVEKRARVREEVTVGKETRQRRQRIKDTVRETQVQIEPLSAEEQHEFAGYTGEFRRDWQTKHASRTGLEYEDVEPGYRYGYRLAKSGRYGKAEWATIEPEIERDWAARGYGRWEQFRDAVRSGWERARH
ncbi:MAG TPA: YsnF/AvaK domain-containing protein [Burkholderiales bacterium]